MQAQKVYVQDRLREGGELVWKLLQEGAHFYVCGDAAHMAGSVEQALLHIVAQHQVELHSHDYTEHGLLVLLLQTWLRLALTCWSCFHLQLLPMCKLNAASLCMGHTKCM